MSPNDYVYRVTISVTLGGKTYTGETVSGCRVQRSPFPDAFNDAFANRWIVRLWATPLTVALSDNRFLLLPANSLASCASVIWRPDPGWKQALGLVHREKPESAAHDPFSPPRIVLFDDAVSPKMGSVLLTREGAESLGLTVSFLSFGPATWREVEDNLARRPGALWLAPVIEKCVRAGKPDCFGGELSGFRLVAQSLAEAMQEPAFAAWAPTTDRSRPMAVVPGRQPPVGALLARRFYDKPRYALTPDWTTGHWIATEQQGLANLVSTPHWPGDIREPTVCPTTGRCMTCRQGTGFGGGFAIADWADGKVLIAEYFRIEIRPIFFGGDLP